MSSVTPGVSASTNTALPRYRLSGDLRERLESVASSASFEPDDLADAYYESASESEWQSHLDPKADSDLLQSLVRTLAAFVIPCDGEHPLLRFALHLAKRTARQVIKDELTAWVFEAAEYIGITPNGLAALQRKIDAAPLHPVRDLHLVVMMEEAATEPDRFLVSAFRVLVPRGKGNWTDEDAWQIDLTELRSLALDEMPKLLNELLDEIAEDLRRCNNELTIEFVVPLPLLNHDADCWELALGAGATTLLGLEYDILIRSWERAYGEQRWKIAPRWEAKWRRVHESGEGTAWACSRDAASNGFARRLHGGGPTCVGLSFAPHSDDGTVPSVLRDLIATGTPVVAWPRHPPLDEVRLSDCIAALVAAPPPRAWPRAIKEVRRDAHCRPDPDPAHPGHLLSIVWDDPNKRVPDMRPESRLMSPQKTRNVQR